ncbi:Flagellar basal body rod protein FlgB [Buchnera aphidicola (Protaphis terricola)]|uniref:flagellar basal body rod protein FlgB n=1 Tax=Buchnera aphidicola TaxID=9 RepID=UPI00346490B8
MFNKINKMFNLHQNLLNLYSKRQEVLSSNIANSETPKYKAMDIKFKDIFKKILKKNNSHFSKIFLQKTSKNHLTPKEKNFFQLKVKPVNTNIIKENGNTVDMNRERIEFLKNTLKYEENLVFIKNEIKNIIRVIKG